VLAERDGQTNGAFLEKLLAEYEARGASLDANVIPAAEARRSVGRNGGHSSSTEASAEPGPVAPVGSKLGACPSSRLQREFVKWNSL
jgi:hypothetical protein